MLDLKKNFKEERNVMQKVLKIQILCYLKDAMVAPSDILVKCTVELGGK